MESVFVL